MTDQIATTPHRFAPAQIPHGVQDRFLVEAARRRQAEAGLRQLFERWGYQEVIPPTFEYYDSLRIGASPELRQSMYRFFDREGRTLALRADFTPQVARMAATKLFDQPMPLRCFYMGSLFRHEEPQAGRKREFTQAGIELLGADTPAADAEAVALAIGALQALRLRDFQVNLGQMAFFRALVQGLPAEVIAPIRESIDQKNSARLADVLGAAGLTGTRSELLFRLPGLIGGAEIVDESLTLSKGLAGTSTAAAAALERLAEVYHLLHAHGVQKHVTLDLGEVRGMDYYTGITFRAMAPGLGWPIASGGRYDDLIGRFGRPLAAVGFGLGVERALLVQARQGTAAPSVTPHLLLLGCNHPSCLAVIKRLRQIGLRVEVDVLGLDAAGLAEQARRRRIPHTLRCVGDAWLLTDERGERTLAPADLLRQAREWAADTPTRPGGIQP